MSPQVYDAIRAHLTANYAATALYFENEIGDAPSVPWALVEFSTGVYSQQSIGAGSQAQNRWDEEGSFFVHIMVPAMSGVREAFSYSAILADLFRGTQLLGELLEFDDVVVGYGGRGDDEGNWYRVSVNVGWRLMDARAR
jgi:hypothetical protein